MFVPVEGWCCRGQLPLCAVPTGGVDYTVGLWIRCSVGAVFPVGIEPEIIALFHIHCIRRITHTNIIQIINLLITYVFSLLVSEIQTYFAGGLQTPSKAISTLLPDYIALNKFI